jgi:hypothetical protein
MRDGLGAVVLWGVHAIGWFEIRANLVGMDDPLVSIIMRSFNEGWALRQTLPALQAQDWQNWELIVIDSGSTDGSVELISQAAPRHFVQIRPQDCNPARSSEIFFPRQIMP